MLCKGTTWLHTAHVPEVGVADPTFTVQDASLMAQIGTLGYGGTPIVGENSGRFKRSSEVSAYCKSLTPTQGATPKRGL